MQANFDSWDLVPVSIPARSRLHSVEPIGIGTPFVESLTGYMIRLAASHAVRVSDLIEYELRSSIPYFHAPAGLPNAINGVNENARSRVSTQSSAQRGPAPNCGGGCQPAGLPRRQQPMRLGTTFVRKADRTPP